jgi:hypothetical protein
MVPVSVARRVILRSLWTVVMSPAKKENTNKRTKKQEEGKGTHEKK